ncbi:MAG: PAS domain S-box protein, partial [Desulfobacterales bacterium]
MGPWKPSRSLADSLRRNMLALSLAPLLAFFLVLAGGAWVARHHVTQLITGSLQRLESMIELMVAGDGGLQIKSRAGDVARQVEAYLLEHPGVTIEELRQSEFFSRIAVQRVGITGYTAIYEAGTGIMRFHPNAELVDRPLSRLAEELPDWWKIYDAPPEGKVDAGFYEWIEPDGFRTRKYMAVSPVKVPLAGRTLMVAATTYLEEFMWAAQIARDLGRAVEREFVHYADAKIGQILLALGLVVGVTLGMLYFLNRRTVRTFIRPIQDLARAVERFGVDPSSPAEVSAIRGRSDEIGELARTYERMKEQISRQIEDMHRARRDLARSEAHYRQAFEEASIGMSIVSLEGVFLEVNRTLASMIGYEPADLIGQAVEKFVHPGDREERRRILEDLRSGRIQYGHHERRLLHRQGSFVWVIFHIHLARGPEGEALHFVSLIQNITQRRRAEEDLRLARLCIEKAAMGIYRLNEEAGILDANEYACRMLGYERGELLQMTVFAVDPRLTPERWKRLVAELKSGTSRIIQSVNRRKDGTMFPVEITANYFQVEGEGVFYAFATDITQRLEVEQERRRLEVQLQQAQKMEAIGTLAGGVAHDFNNILAVIIGNANLLELSASLSASDRTCLRQVLAASGRAKELIKQILAFSRRGVQEKI